MNVKGNHHESSTNGRMIQAYTSYFQISELQSELYSSWSRQNMELSLLFSNTGNMECCIIFMIIMQYSNTQKITYCITISPQKGGLGALILQRKPLGRFVAGSSFCRGLGRQKSDLALQNGDTQPPQVIFWDNHFFMCKTFLFDLLCLAMLVWLLLFDQFLKLELIA